MILAKRTKLYFPVSWDSRIHRLHLCRGVGPRNECPVFDTKQSDAEVPVMPELWGMRSTPSLPLLQVHSGQQWQHLIGPLYLD